MLVLFYLSPFIFCPSVLVNRVSIKKKGVTNLQIITGKHSMEKHFCIKVYWNYLLKYWVCCGQVLLVVIKLTCMIMIMIEKQCTLWLSRLMNVYRARGVPQIDIPRPQAPKKTLLYIVNGCKLYMIQNSLRSIFLGGNAGLRDVDPAQILACHAPMGWTSTPISRTVWRPRALCVTVHAYMGSRVKCQWAGHASAWRVRHMQAPCMMNGALF